VCHVFFAPTGPVSSGAGGGGGAGSAYGPANANISTASVRSQGLAILVWLPAGPALGAVCGYRSSGGQRCRCELQSARGHQWSTGHVVHRHVKSPAPSFARGSGSPVDVVGLTNNVTYTFTVTATTALGTGASLGRLQSGHSTGIPWEAGDYVGDGRVTVKRS